MSDEMVRLIEWAFLTAGGIIISLLAWFSKNFANSTIARLEKIDSSSQNHDVRLGVLERATINSMLPDHEARIKSMEDVVLSIRMDLREIMTESKYVSRTLNAIMKGTWKEDTKS